MNASNPLAELKDIHLPTEPSVLPLSIGWYIIICLFLGLILISLVRQLMKKSKQKRFNHINSLLIAIEQNNNLTHADIVAECSNLLKQVSMLKFAKENPQFISGTEWLDYLQRKVPKFKLSNSELHYLANIYQKHELKDTAKFFADVRHWIWRVI